MEVINTNIMSLTAQNNLSKSQNSLATAMDQLSSGLRITSAASDAAGMAIATGFTTQINGHRWSACYPHRSGVGSVFRVQKLGSERV